MYFQVFSVIVVLQLFFLLVMNQQMNCENVTRCGICILMPHCFWCQDTNKPTNCMKQKNKDKCESAIEGKATISFIENETLSSNTSNPVQMKPQHVSLKLPINRTYTLKFEFARAWNPLDVYFLMDNSETMKKHRTTLSNLADKLVTTLGRITGDFKFGFGSFSEKRLFPFAFHESQGNFSHCSKGHHHSFANGVPLTNNTTDFKGKVMATNSTCNIDLLEGGLDALVQALVCTEEIGWRNDSTHIIVLSTDNEFHVAGDGKLVGIAVPNDGKCYMSGGKYVRDRDMDYPSVSQVNYLMQENNMYVIFAISSDSMEICSTYSNLTKHFPNLTSFAMLDSDSKSVIDILSTYYQSIVSSVHMVHNFLPDVEIKFRVLCNNLWMEMGSCSNLNLSQAVKFEAILNPVKCLPRPQSYRIHAAGINDFLQVDLEVICNCTCELVGSKIDAKECSHNGSLICGHCTCNEGYYGQHCECVGSEKSSCPEYNGLLCSGPGNGKCVCGQCKCSSGWDGADCGCANSTESCKTKFGECDDHGTCKCGTCNCNIGYQGRYCEECLVDNKHCRDRCAKLSDCVKLYTNKTIINNEINCSAVTIKSMSDERLKFVDQVWQECSLTDSGCVTKFRFQSNEPGITVVVGPEQCPISVIQDVTAIIIGTIGGVFGGLMGLLAWKALINLKDEREYKAFLEKTKREKWDIVENPIFRAPSTSYKNPAYNPSVKNDE